MYSFVKLYFIHLKYYILFTFTPVDYIKKLCFRTIRFFQQPFSRMPGNLSRSHWALSLINSLDCIYLPVWCMPQEMCIIGTSPEPTGTSCGGRLTILLLCSDSISASASSVIQSSPTTVILCLLNVLTF